MNQTDHQFFETNDFALAVTLLCSGCHINNLNRGNQAKVGFVFERSGELEKLVRAFWDNQLKISPKDFFNTQKELKARIYSTD